MIQPDDLMLWMSVLWRMILPDDPMTLKVQQMTG